MVLCLFLCIGRFTQFLFLAALYTTFAQPEPRVVPLFALLHEILFIFQCQLITFAYLNVLSYN